MSRRIILSGVHGVGKGYFIKHKIAKYRNIFTVSASAIISEYRDSEDAGNKRVKDVESNQNLLMMSLNKYLKTHTETIVLDGHLVILDAHDYIQRIPKNFFTEGMFDTVLILYDDPKKIYERMFKRDGKHKLSIELIDAIQKAERAYAEELKDMGIDVYYITLDDEEVCAKLFEEERKQWNI